MSTTLYFHKQDAISWVNQHTTLNTKSIETAFENFEYVQQDVFQHVVGYGRFQKMKEDLVWLTENDLNRLGDESPLPNLYIVNPNTPATASLVRIVSGDDNRVRFTHCYGDGEIFETTNRQFILNAVKV